MSTGKVAGASASGVHASVRNRTRTSGWMARTGATCGRTAVGARADGDIDPGSITEMAVNCDLLPPAAALERAESFMKVLV